MKIQEFLEVTKAAIHLYGVITIRDLAQVVVHYYPEESQFSREKAEELLQKLDFDQVDFMVNQELIMDKILDLDKENDGGMLANILEKQKNKPRYFPVKRSQFLQYADVNYHRPTIEYKNLRAFFGRIDPDQEELDELLDQIRFEQCFSYDIDTTFRTILEHNYLPPDPNEQSEMIDLLIAMDATSRKYEYKGHSLWEIDKF